MKTVDVRAKDVYVITEMSAREIAKLKLALSMCTGGPGKTPKEQAAWSFFVTDFWQYINETDKGLTEDGAGSER